MLGAAGVDAVMILDDAIAGPLQFEAWDQVEPECGTEIIAMSREATLKRIVEAGIVAVVRSESSESLVKVVQALADGGVGAAEVTFTVPDAIDVIRQVRREIGDAIVLGAGTVLDTETARAALARRRRIHRGAHAESRRDPALPPLR